MTHAVRFLSVLVVLASCATQSTYDYAKEPDPRRSEYIVGPSDVLRVSVWREPDLSVEVRVRPDGTITMPLIGDVPAAGLPLWKVRGQIVGSLAQFMKTETLQVTVALVAANSYQFSVSGYAEHAGTFSPGKYVTVLEAVTMAGGPNRFASPEKTFVIRSSGAETPRQIPVDLDKLRTGKRLDQNIVVLSGDIIVIP